MNFTEFHKDLSKEFGYSSRTSKKIVSFLMKRLRHKLMFGTEVTLREIGTFVLKVRHPKPFLNLKTGKMGMSKSGKNLNRNWAVRSMSPVNRAVAPSQRINPKNSHRIENGMPQ